MKPQYQHLLSSLDWSRSWHPRIFPVLMSLSLNESYSQHPTYFSVSMSLSLDIHKILNSCWVIKWYRFSWANWYKSEPKIVPKWCKSGPRLGEMVQLTAGNHRILSWNDTNRPQFWKRANSAGSHYNNVRRWPLYEACGPLDRGVCPLLSQPPNLT